MAKTRQPTCWRKPHFRSFQNCLFNIIHCTPRENLHSSEAGSQLIPIMRRQLTILGTLFLSRLSTDSPKTSWKRQKSQNVQDVGNQKELNDTPVSKDMQG